MNRSLYDEAMSKYAGRFGGAPTAAAFAPGRIEVLGNHTDYNEGFVLSAAIDLGTVFLCGPSPDESCSVVAGDLMETHEFRSDSPSPSSTMPWSNYIKGVFSGLFPTAGPGRGFHALFLSDLPLASGLSSSAALEMSCALALREFYGLDRSLMDLAKIGQAAEHHFVGVKCGLLDQISSLMGEEDELVFTDFRSLDVRTVPVLSRDPVCFAVCNTRVKHTLVDSEYNERNAMCRQAAEFFKSVLPHPVSALRDVSWAEWEAHLSGMNALAARRAAHVIGENRRVLDGCDFLLHGDPIHFGGLMYESHESSRKYFQNSCAELDFTVDLTRTLPGVFGARLTGGGFGGSVLILALEESVEAIEKAIGDAFRSRFGVHCEFKTVKPSHGARLIAEEANA